MGLGRLMDIANQGQGRRTWRKGKKRLRHPSTEQKVYRQQEPKQGPGMQSRAGHVPVVTVAGSDTVFK